MNFECSIISRVGFLAELDANASGRITGQGMVLLAFAAGAIKCWSISRRPGTNKKCATALMLLLIGLMGPSSLALLTAFGGAAPNWLFAGFMGLGFVALIIASVVLAIIGLIEMSQKPGVYTQGRGQAVSSLVVTGVLALIACGNVVSRLNEQNRFATKTKPGQDLTFEELNFGLRAPPSPWRAFDAPKLNKDSKAGFLRRNPGVYFIVIAEEIGSVSEFTSERLAETGKTLLEASLSSSRVLSERPFTLNGLNGVLVETEGSMGALKAFYQHWYVVTNGFAYQLVGYGRSSDRARIQAELKPIFGLFHQIDPNRLATSGEKLFTTNYISSRYGYSVDLTNSAWAVFDSLAEDFPEADFGASKGNDCLAIVPVALRDRNLSSDALSAGLLATLDIEYPDEHLLNRRPYQQGKFEGVLFDFEREVENQKIRYRLGILQRDDTGFLVAAWSSRRPSEARTIFDDAFERVHLALEQTPGSPAARSLTERELNTQTEVLNHIGLFHYRAGDYDKALPFFRAAAAGNPKESVYVVNALRALRKLGRAKEALEYLGTQSTEVSGQQEVRALQAHFLAQTSHSDQAITNYSALFADGYADQTQFSEYIDLLSERGAFDQALTEIHRYAEKSDSTAVRVLEAGVYRHKGNYTKAIDLLRLQNEKAPQNAEVASALIEACLAAEDFNQALQVSQELAKRGTESAYSLYLKGRSELGLRWYREAKESFEEAAKRAPADRTIRSFLEHTSGLLGEGSNLEIKEPIEAVGIPSALTNPPTGSPSAEYVSAYGACYDLWLTAVSWESGRDHRTTEYIQARVMDSSGVVSFSTLQRHFDPLGEQIYVNELVVSDSTGRIISMGKVADYYVLDEAADRLATHRKVLNIPIPGLQPGCRISVTITRRTLGKQEGFPFLEHTFSRRFPVLVGGLFVRGDTQNLVYRASPSLVAPQQSGGLYWRVESPTVARLEPLQPLLQTFAPTVWIADGRSRWPNVVSNYLNSIADHLLPDTGLKQLADDVSSGLVDSGDKTVAVANYVQTNYTYKAIEFGRRARVPNKTADIVHNKYGDCKDHALLLQQMLNAIGVPARLALVSHRGPVQTDLPSLDQFDHMIVYVPGEPGRFIDCTDKGADVAHAIPAELAGREALILDSDNPRFVTIPCYPEVASVLELQRDVRVTNEGDLAVEENLKLTGVQAAYLRSYLKALPPASRRESFQRQMGLEDAKLEKLELDSLDAPNAPLQAKLGYTSKRQFHRTESALSGALRAPIERCYLMPAPTDNRLTPFEIRMPTLLKSRVSFQIPEGFRVRQVPSPQFQIDPRFGTCTNRWQLESGRLTIEFDCSERAGRFEPSEYASYRETMTRVIGALEQEVVLTSLAESSGPVR